MFASEAVKKARPLQALTLPRWALKFSPGAGGCQRAESAKDPGALLPAPPPVSLQVLPCP